MRVDVDHESESEKRDPILYRFCVRCRKWKPETEFHNSRTGQFSYCIECRRQYDRVYYRERGRTRRQKRRRAQRDSALDWVAELKRGVPCADCGGVFPAAVMHFDHLPGHTKLDSISSLAQSRTRTLVLEELAKCELVCANCHAIRTAARRRGV